MTKDAYENKLRARGYQLLGRGMYANVFAAPNSDKVIKVGYVDEWPSYIFWATKNGYAGNFAPKVHNLKFHDDFYVASMERLVDTIGGMRSWGSDSDQVSLYHRAANWAFSGNDDKDEADQFQNFILDLRAAGLAGDVHDGNVMVRKDGQVVVTDPTSKRYSGSKYRIKSGQIHNP